MTNEAAILDMLSTKATRIEKIFDAIGWNPENATLLVSMSRARKVHLFRDDDTRSLTRGDLAAENLLGLPRHIAYRA